MFINPIYKWLAWLLAILAVVGVIYGKGRLDSHYSNKIDKLQSELATAKEAIETERNARAVDAINAAASRQRLDALESKSKDLEAYVDQLEDANAVCLSGADTERLRGLWE